MLHAQIRVTKRAPNGELRGNSPDIRGVVEAVGADHLPYNRARLPADIRARANKFIRRFPNTADSERIKDPICNISSYKYVQLKRCIPSTTSAPNEPNRDREGIFEADLACGGPEADVAVAGELLVLDLDRVQQRRLQADGSQRVVASVLETVCRTTTVNHPSAPVQRGGS